MDAMIEQCVRANELRTDWFRGFQRYLVTVIQPLLDELEALKATGAGAGAEELQALQAENASLRTELGELRAQLAAVPVKRGRGRPPKVKPEAVSA